VIDRLKVDPQPRRLFANVFHQSIRLRPITGYESREQFLDGWRMLERKRLSRKLAVAVPPGEGRVRVIEAAILDLHVSGRRQTIPSTK
jgi:hypothetical protein